MNLHAASAYAIHLLKARSTAGHGVHSPFMFRFITEVIGGEYDREIMKEVECLRKEMLADRRLLKVHDLGVGSASLRRGERRIGEIAAAAALPASEAALLARIAASLDMIKLGERGTGLQKNEESGAVPGKNEESEAVPGSNEESGAVPGRNRESGAVPGKNEESEAVPGSNGESAASRSDKRTERDEGDVIITGGMPKGDLNRGIAGSAGDDQEGMLSGGMLNCDPSRSGERTERDEEEVIMIGGMPKGGTNHHTIQPAVILELGTSLGISTLALALGAPDRKVISIEGCPELAAIARENLRNHGADNAEVLSMEFSEALNHLRSLGIMVGMAFIDGNHRGKALEEYVHLIRGMGEEMIIVADDIRMNRDMTSTWKLLSTVRITDRFSGAEEMATGNLLPDSKVTGSSSVATAVIGNSGVPAGTDKTSIAAGAEEMATGNLLPDGKVTGYSSVATAVIGNTGVPAGTDKTSIAAAAEEMATGNLLPDSKVTGSSSVATAVIVNTGFPAGTEKTSISAAGGADVTSISAAGGKAGIATASAAAEKQPLHSLHDKLQPVPVSLETFRLGMLFFLRNITPGHYRVRC